MATLALAHGFVAVLEIAEDEVPRSESTDTAAHRHVCWACRDGWSHVDEACEGGVEATCGDCEMGEPEPWYVGRARL